MAAEETLQRILEHLKEEGPLNTFRLATNLNLNRYKLLNFIEKLEKAGAVEVQHGLVKFAVEEKKVVKKPVTRPSKTRVTQLPETKKTVSKTKPVFFQNLKAENEKLTEKILELKSKVKKLEERPVPPPKIIRKTIIKKVPVPISSQKKKRKLKKEIKPKKIRKKSKRFKVPKFKFMKSIKQLKRPEFAKK